MVACCLAMSGNRRHSSRVAERHFVNSLRLLEDEDLEVLTARVALAALRSCMRRVRLVAPAPPGIWSAVRSLPTTMREVALLRFAAGVRLDAVAAAMDIELSECVALVDEAVSEIYRQPDDYLRL